MRGMGIALYRSAGDIGFLAGPFALGWLADQTSISTALTVSAVLVGAAGVWFMISQATNPAAGRQVGVAAPA